MLVDISTENTSSLPTKLKAFNNNLFFGATKNTKYDYELWKLTENYTLNQYIK